MRSGISCETREFVMKLAIDFLKSDSPCPRFAFSSIIVQHDGPSIDKLKIICYGINNVSEFGITGHGEIEALRNCSKMIKEQFGASYVLNQTFWSTLSLYTTAEPCSMCSSAIRWAGLKEIIFGTSIVDLNDFGWPQLSLFSSNVQAASSNCNFVNTKGQTRIISGVLKSETDSLLSWQYRSNSECPKDCSRINATCT